MGYLFIYIYIYITLTELKNGLFLGIEKLSDMYKMFCCGLQR